MCGIGGVVRADERQPVDVDCLLRMARALQHRGPDGFGLGVGSGVGLVSTRLAIVDIDAGWQPLQVEQGGSTLVYNGEVYNHPELRAELARSGVRCRTRSDTEVVLRCLESEGLPALNRFNGQFAFAWWQPQDRRLTLVRDRFGVRPLYYALDGEGGLCFASSAAAMFASGEVTAEPDLLGLDDVFQTWGARAPRSVFGGVSQLLPGGVLVWERGELVQHGSWWQADVGHRARPPEGDLEDLLRDSVRLRLRADVAVGTYLSGGLDSSLITALAREVVGDGLRTFSVAFEDPAYDESLHQLEVAKALGTQHHVVRISGRHIASGFPDAVRHAESPMVRTAPVPMSLLAQAARERGVVVVATGEGADELFWGYDLFKEALVRRAAVGDSSALTALDDLHPHLDNRARGPGWRHLFAHAGPVDDLLFSHQPRLAAMQTLRSLYRPEVREHLVGVEAASRLRAELPAGFAGWNDLERATWLELSTLLEPYLLAAQGDRPAMTHGVEGRYPFLDHRVFEHAMALPRSDKLVGLDDKIALRRVAERVLPPHIVQRRKQPYRSPEVTPFFEDGAPDWVRESLDPAAVERTGIFDAQRTSALVQRCREGRVRGQREGMALVGVLSTQVWHEHFLAARRPAEAADRTRARVFLDLDGRPALEALG